MAARGSGKYCAAGGLCTVETMKDMNDGPCDPPSARDPSPWRAAEAHQLRLCVKNTSFEIAPEGTNSTGVWTIVAAAPPLSLHRDMSGPASRATNVLSHAAPCVRRSRCAGGLGCMAQRGWKLKWARR
jgi:hypothetical protein